MKMPRDTRKGSLTKEPLKNIAVHEWLMSHLSEAAGTEWEDDGTVRNH
jgi:hypothetical protein